MKKSFTLIELLVAVFVFVILFMIIMSFINLASGQAKSLRTKVLTTDARGVLETISQKVNNANDKKTVGTITIYGFAVNSGILGLASTDGCTFIGKNGTALKMKIDKNCSKWPSPTDLDQPLTGANVEIVNAATEPLFTVKNPFDPASTTPPVLKVNLKLQDTDSKYPENIITLQTSYALDYLTIRKFQNE